MKIPATKPRDDAAAKSPVKAQVFDTPVVSALERSPGRKRSYIVQIEFLTSGARSRRTLHSLTTLSGNDAETPRRFPSADGGFTLGLPDSKEIAYVTNLDTVKATSTNNDVFTLRLDEAGAVAKKVSTAAGSDDGPAYSPDGKWLAWRSQARNGFESDQFKLVAMDRSSGAIKDLLPKFGGWVDEFIWAPSSRQLFFATGRSGREPILTFDFGNPQLMELTREGKFPDPFR